jgi:hypothetical protein
MRLPPLGLRSNSQRSTFAQGLKRWGSSTLRGPAGARILHDQIINIESTFWLLALARRAR